MLHVAVCAYVPTSTHSSLQLKQGLPLLNQMISWTTLGGHQLSLSLFLYDKSPWNICMIIKTRLIKITGISLSPRFLSVCSFVEFYSSVPSSAQYLPLPHSHLPTTEYWVRDSQAMLNKCKLTLQWLAGIVPVLIVRVCVRSEALFPPVLSWLMFVWINIEQEAMLSQGISGRQEV